MEKFSRDSRIQRMSSRIFAPVSRRCLRGVGSGSKKEGVTIQNMEDGLTTGGLILVLVLLIIVNGGIFWIYKRYVQ
jgi:hypothetical protein